MVRRMWPENVERLIDLEGASGLNTGTPCAAFDYSTRVQSNLTCSGEAQSIHARASLDEEVRRRTRPRLALVFST